jgi:glycosyltransferase involved in cell wall biosynthesis
LQVAPESHVSAQYDSQPNFAPLGLKSTAMKPIRILFLPAVDADNTNAQSLNTREIVLRLNPERFDCTLNYWTEPDQRLLGRPHIRLLKMPAHGKTWRVLQAQLAGHDIVAYMDYSPASYLFLHTPRFLRRRVKAVLHAEAPVAQMVNPSWQLRFLSQGIIGRCDVYTGITLYVANDISRFAKEPAGFVLPVGVDCRGFMFPGERSHSVPTVLFAGTLIERKGPQHVIEAAARFPGARFRLVGKARDGYDQVLRRKISEMGLTNVFLDGPRSQQELAGIMRESDIFLLPSRLEGLPKVTLEAAATGLPCIVFRDYETPSVVDGVTGYQVRSLEEMMQRLSELIGNRSLRQSMGDAARQHAQRFDWDIVYRQWEDAYLKIADAAP